MLLIFKGLPLFAATLLTFSSSSEAQQYEYLNDWHTAVNGTRMIVEHVNGLDPTTAPFDVLFIQVRFFDQGTLSDGITEIDTTQMEVSLVARMRDGGTQLGSAIRPYMPKPGCNDSNKIEAAGSQNFSANQDIRSNSNNSITYLATASGTERACDWPKPTYGSWSKNFFLKYDINFDNGILSFRPSVTSKKTSINLRTAGKIGKEALRILDQLASIADGSVTVPDPKGQARQIDVSIANRISRLNDALAGRGLTLPESGFFSADGGFFDVAEKFSWSDSSRFYRNVVTTETCGRASKRSEYFVRFDYTTRSPISSKLANNISKHLIDYLSGFEVRSGHGSGLALAADKQITVSVCDTKSGSNTPTTRSGCFHTLGNGWECRVEP